MFESVERFQKGDISFKAIKEVISYSAVGFQPRLLEVQELINFAHFKLRLFESS